MTGPLPRGRVSTLPSDATFSLERDEDESWLDAALRAARDHGCDEAIRAAYVAHAVDNPPEVAAILALLDQDILPLRREGVS